MSAKGGPVFTFCLPEGSGSPPALPSVTPLQKKSKELGHSLISANVHMCTEVALPAFVHVKQELKTSLAKLLNTIVTRVLL